MYDSTNYMWEKKILFTWTWLAADYTVTQVCRSVVRQRAARSHRSHYLHILCWLHATPLPDLRGRVVSFRRGRRSEKRFHLACLWIYFGRWLLLIGAFWLYSAHVGSLWADWHVSQITQGSSHLKPSTPLRLQKLHPGTCFFTRLFLLIYFCLC